MRYQNHLGHFIPQELRVHKTTSMKAINPKNESLEGLLQKLKGIPLGKCRHGFF